MAAFEYRQATEIRDVFNRLQVRYLFIGKSGAILLGFSDTTQDVDLFVDRTKENCQLLIKALQELGFALTKDQIEEVGRGKDFVQLKNGPFDIELTFAPEDSDRFEDAWCRHLNFEGFHVCHLDDIIASIQATHRRKDMESLPRLQSFREYWQKRQT